MRRALITGITGQDGSYLAELLLAKGYEVHGLIRRASTFNTARIDHLYVDPHDPDARLFLHYGDLTDGVPPGRRCSREIQPDEVYNLAAQSHVRVSLRRARVHRRHRPALGTIRLLEAIRHGRARRRFYQASSLGDVRRDAAAAERGHAVLPALARTAPPRSTPTGSPGTTARPTACSPSTASCSTTSPRAAARPS